MSKERNQGTPTEINANDLVIDDTSSRYQMVDVSVVKQWPTAWVNPGQTTNMKEVSALVQEYLSGLDGYNKVLEVTGETRSWRQNQIDLKSTPTGIFAYACYIVSDFYKSRLKSSNTATLYNLKIDNQTVKVYSRKGITSQPTVSQFTTHDAETTATAIINTAVRKTYDADKTKLALMTAKSRVLVTDDGLTNISRMMTNWNQGDGNDYSVPTVIQMINAGVTNKVNQFRDQRYFDKNVAISCVIAGVMLASTKKESTERIALTKVSKINKIKSGSSVDYNKVAMVLQNFNVADEFDEDSLKDMIRKVSRKNGNLGGSQYITPYVQGVVPVSSPITSGKLSGLNI